MKFILKNSRRLFYFTGSALLGLIVFLILMQFTDIEKKIFEGFLPSSVKENRKPINISIEDKGKAEPDVLFINKEKEITLDASTKKKIETRIKDFLRKWETFPRKDYSESLEEYVLPASLSDIAKRKDSRESKLLDCDTGCSLGSSFPAQEIPISVVQFNEEGVDVRFTAFVRYKNLSGKPDEMAGLEARQYILLMSSDNEGNWLVSRAIAR